MTKIEGNRGTLVLTGRLDILAADEFRARIKTLVANGVKNVVVDLHGVDFMDSAGLGALIGGLKTTRFAGGDFRIARAPEQIRYVLELSRLDRVLIPYNSLEEALVGFTDL